MKKLILVALILQLVIIITTTYEFGDIIAFPRICVNNKATYYHYAVYVGPETGVNVGQGKKYDIVHRAGFGKDQCKFAQLETVKGSSADKKDNYLDGIEKDNKEKFKKGEIEDIKTRIKDFITDCPEYKLTSTNCEYFATTIRYDFGISLQAGARSQCFVVKDEKSKEILARVRNNIIVEANCETSSQVSG